MADFAVFFSLTSDDVKKINGVKQHITLVKSAVSSDMPVAWLSFPAMQQIDVNWAENYFIYASTTEVKSGATIKATSTTDDAVVESKLYTYDAGTFSSGAGGNTGEFDGFNKSKDTLTFGLAQVAKVNGDKKVAPINAISVLGNQSMSFVPSVTLSVFLFRKENNGTVLSQIQGGAFDFTLTLKDPTIHLVFDPVNNTFAKGSSNELDRLTVKHMLQLA